MIKKLELKNFKCFNSHEIDFAPLTILAGANATGKSSVIQSLLLAHHSALEAMNKRKQININAPYMLNLGQPSKVRSSSPVDNSSEIKITVIFTNMENANFGFEVSDENSSFYLKTVDHSDLLSNLSLRYLNAERTGPRQFTQMNTEHFFLGYQGEYTPYVITQADLKDMEVHRNLIAEEKTPKKFSAQVEGWLQAIIQGIQLTLQSQPELRIIKTMYRNAISQDYILPTATAFGISYVLPIIAAGLLSSAEKNPLLIIENPEAHLHPYGQSNMGKFLAVLACCGIQVVVETHSEHIIDGARLQLTLMNETDKFGAVFFQEQKDCILANQILLKSNGELTSWPKGFFDQKQNDLRELLRLKK